jgi:hypothetical protein
MFDKYMATMLVLFTLLTAIFLSVGCADSKSPLINYSSADDDTPATEVPIGAPGDSTVYALAAAGSNDSILVYLRLPYNGADPDTVDALNALQNRQVFGRPEVGDNVAIVLNDSDQTIAERIIVMEKLAGQWCYEVTPRLRRQLGEGPLPARLQKMLEEKREYGIVMKLSGDVRSLGAHARQSDEQLPVVYPKAKNYGRWAIFNGRLVLSEVKHPEGTEKAEVTVVSTDTADFVSMRRDTLILRFSDGERKYYKKIEEK